jgi:hypothetical protein
MTSRFLLAQLYLDTLIDKRTPRAIKSALKELPKGIDDSYEAVMTRLGRQPAESRDLATRALSWIVCARRSLTTLELREALAVKSGDTELDECRVPDIELVVSVCAGLVAVDEKSNTIRLQHFTAQQYFERSQTRWFPDAHTYIARTCLTYLLFDLFESDFYTTSDAAWLEQHPLYSYAAQYWGDHERLALHKADRIRRGGRASDTDLVLYETEHWLEEEYTLVRRERIGAVVEDLALYFLVSHAQVSASIQAMIAPRGYNRSGRDANGIHLAAFFGLTKALTALLKTGHDPNSKDTHGRTPLSWAAENGQEAIVRLFLNMDSIKPDLKDKSK